MSKRMTAGAFAAAAFLLSACASGGPSPETTTPAAPAATAVTLPGAEQGLSVDKLSGQKLEPGECGLFLFASKPSPRLVFFAEASKAVAKIVLNGRELTLARQSFDGAIIDQHYTEQTYISALGHKVDISLAERRDIPDGTQIEKASLRVTSPDGWSIVVPASGATTCKG